MYKLLWRLALLGTMTCRVAAASVYTVPDAALMQPDFGISWSESQLAKSALTGGGVALTLGMAGETGIGNHWNVVSGMLPELGLRWDPELSHYSSLLGYSAYEMIVHYAEGPENVTLDLRLYLNTGMVGLSGYPSNDPRNDTWWGGEVVSLSPGQTAILRLDFNYAQAFNIEDNPYPHSEWDNPDRYDGMWTAINERDRQEIDGIGLVVNDPTGAAFGSTITLHTNIPEPATLLLTLSAAATLACRRRR